MVDDPIKKAAEIDALIKKDAEEKEAKAKADAAMGENMDKMLSCLDSDQAARCDGSR